ncbi:hypothetical protein FS842_008923 [Serendipita sp. 407]|nr:hypothetical protein FS842_008923 [Serendipita sp. 407]
MPSTLFRPGLSGRGLLLALLFIHDTLAQFTTSDSSLVRIPSTHTRSFSFNFAIPTSGIAPGQFGPKFELFFKQQRRLSALVSVLLVVSIILFCLLLSLLTFFFCNRSRQARQKLQEEHLEGGLDQQRRWDTVKEFQFNNSNNNNRLAGYDSRRDASKHKSRRLLVRRRSQDDTWQMRLRRFIRGDKSTASLLPLSTSSGRRGNTEPLGMSASTTGGRRGGVTILTNTNGPPTVGSLAFEKKEEWYGSERLPLKRPPPLVLKQEQKETVPTRQTFGAAFRPPSRDVGREPFSVRAAKGGTSDVIRTQAEFRESGETKARSQQQQSSRAQASYSRRSFTNLSSLFSPSTPERRQNIRSNEFARASSAIVDLESAMSPRLR